MAKGNEMQVLQSGKITDRGRWPLGRELMKFLDVRGMFPSSRHFPVFIIQYCLV
jgi:hypothetical protein